MAGTNAVKAKKAVIDLLTTTFEGTGVQVSYHYPGRVPMRELVHAGRAEGSHAFHAMKGGRPQHARQETITFRLMVVVERPGADPYDVELRCVEIGEEIENALSTAFSVGGVPGLELIRVTGVDVDSDVDDEGAFAVLTYDVTTVSVLT
ncbi:hypothetical protein [Lentzea sp. NBRC 102530]|uniref:hypothetical protein n=1 Tax=Lentzea sp. NBRC 102530 TaxID=3032201 RepID=UPI0024A2359C|nr:hypothetical protein [Lentzea sp. NBRC 102530]GLY55218.1 hypothetical protein Lesp01_88730 [Lentzea sp. NBRC 102530]